MIPEGASPKETLLVVVAVSVAELCTSSQLTEHLIKNLSTGHNRVDLCKRTKHFGYGEHMLVSKYGHRLSITCPHQHPLQTCTAAWQPTRSCPRPSWRQHKTQKPIQIHQLLAVKTSGILRGSQTCAWWLKYRKFHAHSWCLVHRNCRI